MPVCPQVMKYFNCRSQSSFMPKSPPIIDEIGTQMEKWIIIVKLLVQVWSLVFVFETSRLKTQDQS